MIVTRNLEVTAGPAELEIHLSGYVLGASVITISKRCACTGPPAGPWGERARETVATVEITFDGPPDEDALDAALGDLG